MAEELTEEQQHMYQQEICNLQADLTSCVSEIGDWKVIKCYEASLTGAEAPYNIKELHAKRQAARDRISELRELLGY